MLFYTTKLGLVLSKLLDFCSKILDYCCMDTKTGTFFPFFGAKRPIFAIEVTNVTAFNGRNGRRIEDTYSS
ncbi:hypothetical protein C7N43_28845 [Sphingobacteriales bacterium UPWRP_1]|nr:hypothetical protein B6N25_04460 [Sphingobacteriales bacterium TSM_CSS]PSJ73509.1 hypothetical protein C7N43_28845 [Sphingobacteriales bacterium UPWRP_1]